MSNETNPHMNGFVPLADVVLAFTNYRLVNDASHLSAEELHDLARLMTDARHDKHGQRKAVREIICLADRDGNEVYREEVTMSDIEGDI